MGNNFFWTSTARFIRLLVLICTTLINMSFLRSFYLIIYGKYMALIFFFPSALIKTFLCLIILRDLFGFFKIFFQSRTSTQMRTSFFPSRVLRQKSEFCSFNLVQEFETRTRISFSSVSYFFSTKSVVL